MKKTVKKVSRNKQFCIFKSGAFVYMRQMKPAAGCVPQSMYAVSSNGLPAHLCGQRSCSPWISGDSGSLNRGHGTTKSSSADTLALAILQPVLQLLISIAISRGAEGNASHLLYQSFRCQWKLSKMLRVAGLGKVDWH